MALTVIDSSPLQAYAMLVDINDFLPMVQRAVEGHTHGEFIAQFVRDILAHVIETIEAHQGEVVSVMGDAVLGIFPHDSGVIEACIGIARTVNRECRHISEHQCACPEDWDYSPGGVSLKIGIEFGWMGVAEIASHRLGTQPMLIGPPVNYASRISRAGRGNRCLIGPIAAHMPPFSSRHPRGPFHCPGKKLEADFAYYELDLAEFWQPGARSSGIPTYLDEPPLAADSRNAPDCR